MITEKRVSATKEEASHDETERFEKVYVYENTCIMKQLTSRILVSKEQALLLQGRAQYAGYNRVAGMLKVIDQIFETLVGTLKETRIEANTCKPSKNDESLIPTIEDPLHSGKEVYIDGNQFVCSGYCQGCEHYHDVDRSSIF